MKKLFLGIFLGFLWACLSWPGFAMVGVAQDTSQPLELVVQYRSTAVAPAAQGVLDHIKAGKRIMKFSSETELQGAVNQLRADPNVVYVERAHRVNAQFIPNDPLYSQQWDKKLQHLDVANDKETGKPNVIILISDTAYDCTTHPDLAPVCRQDLSRDFITDSTYFWHGYHVAGIAAAAIDNGVAIAGTAGTANIAFARFLDHNGSGSTADGLKTWNYALDLASQGYRVVVNSSWGSSGGAEQSFVEAAAAMRAAGIVNLAAAGNSHTDNCQTPFYPAAYKDVIAVASTDSADALSSFSNFGNCSEDVGGVLLAAPGTGIVSLDLGTGTRTASGTSMATPQVAGAVALILSQRPDITIDAIKDRLWQGSVNLGLPVISSARLDLPGVLADPVPGIRLTAACPSPAEVNQEEHLVCSTALSGVGGFAETADITCSPIAGAICDVSPTKVAVGQKAAVTFTPSKATPPANYVLKLRAASSVGEASAQAAVAVRPFGTKVLDFVSDEVAPLGRTCFNCPLVTSAETKINVPNNVKVLKLSGVGHIHWFPRTSLKVSLTSPQGTVLDIPLTSTGTEHDPAFQTDIFKGELAAGDWRFRIWMTSANSIYNGALKGWEMSMLSVPAEPPSPPPAPKIAFPALSFDWLVENEAICNASGNWTGEKPGQGTIRLSAPFNGTYTLTCSNITGSDHKSIDVTVH